MSSIVRMPSVRATRKSAAMAMGRAAAPRRPLPRTAELLPWSREWSSTTSCGMRHTRRCGASCPASKRPSLSRLSAPTASAVRRSYLVSGRDDQRLGARRHNGAPGRRAGHRARPSHQRARRRCGPARPHRARPQRGPHRHGERLTVEAGAELPGLVAELAGQGLAGLEFAGNIPGSVGGAVVGNAGAYGRAVSDVLLSVHLLDGTTEHVKEPRRARLRLPDEPLQAAARADRPVGNVPAAPRRARAHCSPRSPATRSCAAASIRSSTPAAAATSRTPVARAAGGPPHRGRRPQGLRAAARRASARSTPTSSSRCRAPRPPTSSLWPPRSSAACASRAATTWWKRCAASASSGGAALRCGASRHAAALYLPRPARANPPAGAGVSHLRRKTIEELPHGLVDRLRREQPEARAEFFRRYAPQVRRILFLQGFCEEVDDAVQEVFIKVYRAQIPAEETFLAWFYRVILNTGRDQGRRRKTRHGLMDKLHQIAPEVSADAPSDRPTPRCARRWPSCRRSFVSAWRCASSPICRWTRSPRPRTSPWGRSSRGCTVP